MVGGRIFKNQDLVLTVSEDIDPKVFDTSKYEAFLDILCGSREYQKEAVRVTLRYLLGGQYDNLRELARENYHNNPVLQEKYTSFAEFESYLQLPDHLACSLDLATGTGKSYVIYGIARIMLAYGAVDQVLVLCPSNTIERGLTGKFRKLSGDRDLRDVLPDYSEILNPRIINASQTIRRGDVCIENIHATYVTAHSAIEDSLKGKGERTLVLNDEAHHIFSPADRRLKKWKEFLIDPAYGFHYILGDTGTAYIGDEYFPDVIYRFSLRDAIEQGFVKTIDYVAEDSSGYEEEKFQKIYDNHLENKTHRYRKVKPLTIIVTKNIAACERLTERWIDFLADKETITQKTAADKVLIVTSSPKHAANVAKLERVDERDSPVEWITSVSMLSEGWDVDNVFQVVPHEERAFNSKLLIAQVLGRGLRVPTEYKGERPVVTVFNHDKWSQSIKHLVNEVLEIEKRIASYPIDKAEDYNFEVLNIDYAKAEEIVEVPQEEEYDLLSKGFITYSTQESAVEKETVYERAVTEERRTKKTLVEFRMYSVDEVAYQVWAKLQLYDSDAGTSYSERYSPNTIASLVRASLERIGEQGDQVSRENLQKTLQAFGVIRRRKAKYLRYRIEPRGLIPVRTETMRKSSMGVGSLRRDATVFYDPYSLMTSPDKDREILAELLDDETLPRSALVEVSNKYNFKTPVNVAFASFKPERDFIRRLVSPENARIIAAWLKAPDVGFYSIEYSWRKGEHPKQGAFNPDFFIRKNADILVIEVKQDGDVNDENRAKLKYAREHFDRLNELQSEQTYYFNFLSPESYDLFFQELRAGKYAAFKSKLEADLE